MNFKKIFLSISVALIFLGKIHAASQFAPEYCDSDSEQVVINFNELDSVMDKIRTEVTQHLKKDIPISEERMPLFGNLYIPFINIKALTTEINETNTPILNAFLSEIHKKIGVEKIKQTLIIKAKNEPLDIDHAMGAFSDKHSDGTNEIKLGLELIKNLTSEEFAFIVGHEDAHLKLNHLDKDKLIKNILSVCLYGSFLISTFLPEQYREHLNYLNLLPTIVSSVFMIYHLCSKYKLDRIHPLQKITLWSNMIFSFACPIFFPIISNINQNPVTGFIRHWLGYRLFIYPGYIGQRMELEADTISVKKLKNPKAGIYALDKIFKIVINSGSDATTSSVRRAINTFLWLAENTLDIALNIFCGTHHPTIFLRNKNFEQIAQNERP